MNTPSVTTTIQITIVRMPMLGHVTRTLPTPMQTTQPGTVITATLNATMRTPPPMPAARRKPPGMLRLPGIMPATPKRVGIMIMETMGTTADISGLV
jgi:hypothetical protein